MTDEQINEAITQATGLWDYPYSNETKRMYDFCSDLNAMHEAEKGLKGYEQIHTYVWNLQNRKDWVTDFKLMEVHASARDRAEAFLRTLGKWDQSGDTTEMVEEVQK